MIIAKYDDYLKCWFGSKILKIIGKPLPLIFGGWRLVFIKVAPEQHLENAQLDETVPGWRENTLGAKQT